MSAPGMAGVLSGMAGPAGITRHKLARCEAGQCEEEQESQRLQVTR